MLRSKSANRLLGGAAALLLAVDLSGLRADDAFQMPVPASPDAPVTANFGDTPAATPAPSTDRWARRNQQMRDAALQGAGGTSQSSNQPFAPQQTLAQQPLAQPSQQQPTAAQFGAYAQQPMDLSQRVPPAPAQSANGYPQQFAPAPAGMNYMAQAQKLPFSGKFGSGTQRQGAIPDLGNLPEAEQAKTPAQLPKVTQILPFLDYEPDPKVAAEDPCQNLCPRPDGAPCKTADGKGPECPKEIQLSSGPFEPRVFPASTYTWQASNIFYQPLYFEDPDLERYGHAYPFFIQPIVSSLRFTTQAIGLPYQMTIDPPCCRVYPLGFYRPGECAPKLIYQIPWNTEAAAVEAGAITGVYFLFPHSAWAM
ncbi:MAG TPA: hypothetical protein VFG04_11550 [Planctomycetaceae bacterium]|jgi:hypothetical protein|nr:hypothetical protein [Planctomycetaceae bacterium]